MSSSSARISGNAYFARALSAYGVTHVFTVPTVAVPMFAELDYLGVKGISVHSEKAAAYMADGYARASSRPGVCFAQGVGSANLLSGLRDATMASSPVIAVTGGGSASTRYKHRYQDVEDFSAFEAYTKMNVQLAEVKRLPDLLRQAFRSATSGSPGPVHIQLDGEVGSVLAEEFHWNNSVSPLSEDRFAVAPPFRPAAERRDLVDALRVLAESTRPVIVAGGGARISRAGVEILRLAALIGAPVATSLTGKGIIDETSPSAIGVVGSSSRESANRIVARADLVILIGTHAGSQVTDNWRLPVQGVGNVIQIDIDPLELGRNYPNAASLLGDAKTVISQLIHELSSGQTAEPSVSQRNESWAIEAYGAVREWRSRMAPALHSAEVPMRPERLCGALNEYAGDDAIYVVDTGHSGIWTAGLIDVRPPQSFIRSAGSLGWAFPAAIGAKCAVPEQTVVCFTGDGGLYYHLGELETASRYGINVVVVVNDNRSFSQDFEPFDSAYEGAQTIQGRAMWWFKDINLAEVAAGFGWRAERVTEAASLDSAILDSRSTDRPVFLDVVTDPMALPEPPFGGSSFYGSGSSSQ